MNDYPVSQHPEYLRKVEEARGFILPWLAEHDEVIESQLVRYNQSWPLDFTLFYSEPPILCVSDSAWLLCCIKDCLLRTPHHFYSWVRVTHILRPSAHDLLALKVRR